VGTQRRKLRSTRRRLEHFQAQHKDSFSQKDIRVFKKTEKAIVETTKVLVPENRRRTNGLASRSNSRESQYTQAQHHSPWPQRNKPSDHSTERPPRSVSSNSSLRLNQLAIPATAPQTTRLQPDLNRSRPIITTSEITKEHRVTVEKPVKPVTGSRVRDDGVEVREEFGDWPSQVFSEEEKKLPEAHVQRSSRKRKGSGSGGVDGNQRPLSSSAQDFQATWGRGQVPHENGEGSSRGQLGSGRWQPMPPFTGSDLSERRRWRSA
jgi:hypothetical protein